LASWEKEHTKMYNMDCKLSEKDIGAISAAGIKDSALGMLTPHQMDLCEVKKETACLEELEKLKKESSTSWLAL
jgi:hypothetical protein